MQHLKINKKNLLLSIIFVIFLNGCAQNVSLLGPAYTLGSSGNALQAGLSYGTNEIVTKITGKTAAENVKEILQPESSDSKFRKLVKKRIIETRKKLNLVK